jgi:hypothetical protein
MTSPFTKNSLEYTPLYCILSGLNTKISEEFYNLLNTHIDPSEFSWTFYMQLVKADDKKYYLTTMLMDRNSYILPTITYNVFTAKTIKIDLPKLITYYKTHVFSDKYFILTFENKKYTTQDIDSILAEWKSSMTSHYDTITNKPAE